MKDGVANRETLATINMVKAILGPDHERLLREMGVELEKWLKTRFPAQELLAAMFEPWAAASESLNRTLAEMTEGLPLTRSYHPVLPQGLNDALRDLQKPPDICQENKRYGTTITDKPRRRIGFRQ